MSRSHAFWSRNSSASRRALPALMLAFASSLLSRRAESQNVETRDAAAEVLFLEGRRLMKLGRPAEACRKFRESQRLDPGIGTLMNLAQCSAKQGLTASAWAMYRQAAALAQAAGQDARERIARREADALEPRLAKVTVRVAFSATAARSSLTFDGMPLGEELWGVPLPVDPGSHELRAVAPGHRAWATRFEIAPERSLELQVPVLTPVPTSERAEPLGSRWTLRHSAALAQASVAAGALALGAILAVSARSQYDDAPGCTRSNACGPEGLRAREAAIDRANLATVSLVVGVSALAGAGALWFSAPPLARPARGWSPTSLASGTRREPWLLGVRAAW